MSRELPSPRMGEVVAGRYRLVRELGRGAMGSVWRAENLAIAADCAVKLMLPAVDDAGELRRRFLREARLVGRLRSPHIVTVFDAGEWQDSLYIAMELLEGETLASRLKREGRLDIATTAAFVAQLAQGLDVAHELGVVHRDLKPENILVTKGEPPLLKILDFGVAKYLGTTAAPETSHGALFGTVYYMSPEQARGEPDIDRRTDTWALGVVAFQCLTGALPFTGNSVAEVLGAILHGDARPLDVPGFEEFWRRASRKQRSARFQSARELAAALRTCAGSASSSGDHDVPLLASPARIRVTHRRRIGLTLLVLVFAAATWISLSRDEAASPRGASSDLTARERSEPTLPAKTQATQPGLPTSEPRERGEVGTASDAGRSDLLLEPHEQRAAEVQTAPYPPSPMSASKARGRPTPRADKPAPKHEPARKAAPLQDLERYDEQIGF